MDDNNISDTPKNSTPEDDATKPADSTQGEPEEYNALLQAELDRYKMDMEALQSEFNKADEATSPAVTKRALISAAPSAIQEIILLSTTAESESVRLTASKYVVDVALGKSKLDNDADGFNNLIEQLMDEKKAADAEKSSAKKKD